MAGGWKIKFTFFYADTSKAVVLRQIKFGRLQFKMMNVLSRFILITVLFDEAFKYGDVAKF
jgi:hypothetical protein